MSSPYFAIEVQLPRSTDEYRPVFLDTSLQQMLYNPLISDSDPMNNHSTTWVIQTKDGQDPPTFPDGRPVPGKYLISNFVTQGVRLSTGSLITGPGGARGEAYRVQVWARSLLTGPRGGEAYSVQVLDQGADQQKFTLTTKTARSTRYSITTPVNGQTGYLMPVTVSLEPTPRSNLITARVSPVPDDPYVFQFGEVNLQFAICGVPKLHFKKEMQRQEQEEGASVEIVEETMETCGAVEEATVVKKRVNYVESAAGLMAEKPLSLIYPANMTSLTPDFLMVRAAGDTPYFTIEVRPDILSNDQSVFLDTSLQQMLYDPIISDGDPMDNLSSIWIIRKAGGFPPNDDFDGPAPGAYTISNFVTKKARLMTGSLVSHGSVKSGKESYSIEVLDQGSRDVQIFTLGFSNFRYSITTVIEGQTAYLMPTKAPNSSHETPPRNNLIVAVVSPKPDNPYVFRIRGTSLQFSVCGEPKFQWK